MIVKRTLLIQKRKMSLKPQMVVADELGISQGCYSNFENGYSDPTDEQAAKLIEMFDLPEDYFKAKEGESDGQE